MRDSRQADDQINQKPEAAEISSTTSGISDSGDQQIWKKAQETKLPNEFNNDLILTESNRDSSRVSTTDTTFEIAQVIAPPAAPAANNIVPFTRAGAAATEATSAGAVRALGAASPFIEIAAPALIIGVPAAILTDIGLKTQKLNDYNQQVDRQAEIDSRLNNHFNKRGIIFDADGVPHKASSKEPESSVPSTGDNLSNTQSKPSSKFELPNLPTVQELNREQQIRSDRMQAQIEESQRKTNEAQRQLQREFQNSDKLREAESKAHVQFMGANSFDSTKPPTQVDYFYIPGGPCKRATVSEQSMYQDLLKKGEGPARAALVTGGGDMLKWWHDMPDAKRDALISVLPGQFSTHETLKDAYRAYKEQPEPLEKEKPKTRPSIDKDLPPVELPPRPSQPIYEPYRAPTPLEVDRSKEPPAQLPEQPQEKPSKPFSNEPQELKTPPERPISPGLPENPIEISPNLPDKSDIPIERDQKPEILPPSDNPIEPGKTREITPDDFLPELNLFEDVDLSPYSPSAGVKKGPFNYYDEETGALVDKADGERIMAEQEAQKVRDELTDPGTEIRGNWLMGHERVTADGKRTPLSSEEVREQRNIQEEANTDRNLSSGARIERGFLGLGSPRQINPDGSVEHLTSEQAAERQARQERLRSGEQVGSHSDVSRGGVQRAGGSNDAGRETAEFRPSSGQLLGKGTTAEVRSNGDGTASKVGFYNAKEEAENLQKLRNAGLPVPKVYEYGKISGSAKEGIKMDEISGGRTLREALDDPNTSKQAKEAYKEQIEQIYSTMNSREIAVPDFSPRNLMVDKNGKLWLIDAQRIETGAQAKRTAQEAEGKIIDSVNTSIRRQDKASGRSSTDSSSQSAPNYGSGDAFERLVENERRLRQPLSQEETMQQLKKEAEDNKPKLAEEERTRNEAAGLRFDENGKLSETRGRDGVWRPTK